jgi:hypothetical protein
MADFKIFRLHDAKATGTHWHTTNKLTEAEIQEIKDPADANHRIPVTSIPSPFGRLHLVENSFKKLNEWATHNPSKLLGDTIYHKLVSETFDLAELMFNADSFNNAGLGLEVVNWEVNSKIAELRIQGPKKKLLADTLDLFIKQSPAGSPLQMVQNIYIIQMSRRVIGGTSPSTLFFPTPNEENFVTPTPIKIGNDTLFDHDFNPLYKRSKEFQRFLYLFFEAFPQLKTQAALMYAHMSVNLKMLQGHDLALWNELMGYPMIGESNAQGKLMAEYQIANVSGPGTPMQIIPGVFWYKSKEGSNTATAESDFFIGSFTGGENTKTRETRKPLVLQNNYGFPLKYWGGTWDAKTWVPYQDGKALDQRTLPGLLVQYPYLTVSDFLEPALLRLPFKLNDKRYFDGNAQGFNKGNKAENIAPEGLFLLPLTRKFFEFFNTDDLWRKHFDGTNVFELIKLDDQSVKAVLRIPIKKANSYITLERTYRVGTAPKIGERDNEGAIVDTAVNVGIMPFFRNVSNQRVAILERDPQNPTVNYSVKFYCNQHSNALSIAQEAERSSIKSGDSATSNYYKVNDNFDYFILSKGAYNGVVVPKFPYWQEGMGNFVFAIDFGTTNTHIEYSANGAQPKPFDITEQDEQLGLMHDPEWDIQPREIQSYFLYEMIPNHVGGEYSFPNRTALAQGNRVNLMGAVLTYGDFNPALYFEQKKKLAQTNIHTNIKWSNVPGDVPNQKRVRAYLESLMMLIRNKVLLNGGSLINTKVIWFFPASMSHFTLGGLRENWTSLFKEYFPNTNAMNLVSYSESEAPFYHKASQIPSTKPVVSIDIGGGSSDILIFHNNSPELYTSVKFAGNALYGNGFNKVADLNNGFVQGFRNHVEAFLQANYYSLLDLNELYEQFSNPSTGNSADLISFLFSLEKNHDIKRRNLEFSFSKLLQQDTNFKPVYYLFFGSIIYYVARTMKVTGMQMPEHILLTGNGAKNLNLLDVSGGALFSKMSINIFEHVYGSPCSGNGLQTHQMDEPKQATCRGGIQRLTAWSNSPSQQPENLIWLGDKKGSISNEQPVRYATNRIKYEEVNDEYLQGVMEEVKSFLDFMFTTMRDKMRLSDFGLNLGKMDAYKQYIMLGLDGYLSAGLTDRIASTDKANPLEETLFFYPMIGALHRLGLGIAKGEV